MADKDIDNETKARVLMTDFEKNQGAKFKYLKLIPSLHYDMGALLHRVHCNLDSIQ